MLEDEVLSIDEMIDRHRGKWVLMRVTEHDEDHWPAAGNVVATAASQQELLEAEERAPRPVAGQPYYAFPARPDIVSGPVYDTMVGKFVADLIGAMRGGRDRVGA